MIQRLLVPLVLLAGLVAAPAWAHKVIASAYVVGGGIEGEIGFSNGDMAREERVTVTTPDGRSLGEIRTDADGFFTFTPTEAVDHVFRADLGAGHVAEVTVAAADLPKDLGGPAASPETTDAPPGTAEATASSTPTAAPDDAALRAMIAETLRDEVRPLRRELVAYREKNDLQSILGGIGYIVGIFGVAFYLIGRQRLKRA